MGFLKIFKEWKALNEKISNSFKGRDKKIAENRRGIENNKLEIAQLKGMISVLVAKSQVSVSLSPKKSQKVSNGKIETKIINKLRRSKKAVVMAEIEKLMPSTPIPDIKVLLVDEKGLCSKASFYRYVLKISKSQSQKLRQN